LVTDATAAFGSDGMKAAGRTPEELNVVVGGMMNDGRGQLDPKAPGALPEPGTNGGPAGYDGKWVGAFSFWDLRSFSPRSAYKIT
jgi:hypothetical protein